MDPSMDLNQTAVEVSLSRHHSLRIHSLWVNNHYILCMYRFVNSGLLLPIPCCWHYDRIGCSTTYNGSDTIDDTSGEVPAGLGQLVGDSTLPLLDNLCICVCYSMPMCVPLAVEVWSDSNFPGMDCIDHISPEVASHRCLFPRICTHLPVLSESGFTCSPVDNCIWTDILLAVS